MKTILKFIGILFLTGFIMIFLASFIPALQTDFFGFATYIVPWIVAVLFTKKKQASAKETATNRPGLSQPVTKTPAPVRKPTAAPQKPGGTEYPPIDQKPKHTPVSSAVKEVTVTQPDVKIKTYKVAGVNYYTDSIMNLACENSDYDMTKRELIDFGYIEEKVWKYNFYPSKLELQPEPDNPHDSNAIKVIIDGEHVGYIKKGSCSHIHKLIEHGTVIHADCKIGGGPYKFISEDYDYDKGKEVYSLERGEQQYFIYLEITEEL